MCATFGLPFRQRSPTALRAMQASPLSPAKFREMTSFRQERARAYLVSQAGPAGSILKCRNEENIMKRSLAMITALLMASASAPAFAENSGAKAGTSADAEYKMDADSAGKSGLSLDTGTTASTNGKANFGSVISSIRSGKMDTAEIEALTDASNVSIVRIDSLTGAADEPQALDNALSDNQEQLDKLQTAFETELQANAELKTLFDEESVTADSVVAAETTADGDLTIYVR